MPAGHRYAFFMNKKMRKYINNTYFLYIRGNLELSFIY